MFRKLLIMSLILLIGCIVPVAEQPINGEPGDIPELTDSPFPKTKDGADAPAMDKEGSVLPVESDKSVPTADKAVPTSDKSAPTLDDAVPEKGVVNADDVVPSDKVVGSEVDHTQLTKFYNETVWMRMEVEDLLTNKTFTIQDFKGEVVIVESFSLYCYDCGEQRLKLTSFLQEKNDTITLVSVDTTRNPDREEVFRHVTRNRYDWMFGVSSTPMRKSMIDRYSQDVVKYDQNPLIIVCKDQSSHLALGGVKGSHRLQVALDEC